MTTLFLDVDGVINANGALRPRAKGRATSDDGSEWTIVWSPRIVDLLRNRDWDLIWATTWQDAAVTDIAPLIDYGRHGAVLHPPVGVHPWPSIIWKRFAIQEWVATHQGEKWIHFDDENAEDVATSGYWYDWAQANNGYVAYINPAVGLTERTIHMATEWANGDER